MKNYLYQGGATEDAQRNYENRDLTNEQLKSKVKEAIEREKAGKLIAQRMYPKWMKVLEWDNILSTKLFNSPKL